MLKELLFQIKIRFFERTGKSYGTEKVDAIYCTKAHGLRTFDVNAEYYH